METMNLDYALSCAFGAEWSTLSPRDKLNVSADFASAIREGKCDSREYQRRIGKGNLQAYADCLRVQS